MKYYNRNVEKTLRVLASQFRVLGVTGARQTGKSTLLKKVFPKHTYISLDHQQDLRLAQKDPELFFEQYQGSLFIDEIQYAPELLHYIKMKVDVSNKPGQFIVTGSQKFILMKGLQESLAGRIALIDLYPMAIGEGPFARQSFVQRIIRGSYPEPLCSNVKNIDAWFSSYISTYIERDVEYHFRLEKIEVFKDFIFLLASKIGQILNYQGLSADLGVSIHAVRTWIKILEASQIIYLLRPYYVNLGSRIVKSPKIYFTDIGLAAYMMGIRDKEVLIKSPQSGALFENFIIQELLKFYANRGQDAPLYYYRSNNGLEIDLIIQKNPLLILPCEIKSSKTPSDRMVNNIHRLRNLSKHKSIVIGNGYLIYQGSKRFILNKKDAALPLELLFDEI